MEGACVYINNLNQSTLIMYKEFENNKVFYLSYCNNNLNFTYITTKELTNILPKDCIHILTRLYIDCYSLENTLNIWKNLALNALLKYDKKKEKNYTYSKTDFYERFKL